jgi:transposase
MTTSTETKTLYVGVDMSKDKFDVAGSAKEQTTTIGQFPNREEGWEKLAAQAEALAKKENCDQIHLIIEPTGGYHMALVAFAFEQNWLVSLPNPKNVRDWAKAMGVRVKNDKVDSRMLAEFGQARRPQPENQLPEQVAALDSLLRRQDDLEQMLRAERNRRHALGYKPHASPQATASVDRLIGLLEQELAEVEAAIQQHVQQHQELHQNVRLLLGVSGIGPKTVLTVLTFLYRWQARTAGRGTAKGLVAFAGLDPQAYESGSSVYKRPNISKMGCTFTRHRLFMAAKGGVRAKAGPLRQFYDRLRGRNKPYRLAVIASARKILSWAFVVFSRHEPFNPVLAGASAG